jgi:hypothetical protein
LQYGSIAARKVDRTTCWVLVGAALITAIYALTSLALPFGWDHGMMASVGSTYIRGKLPYVDGWDMKGPISYLPYALVEFLFGPTMWGIRIFDILFTATASIAYFKCIRSLTTWRVGIWAGVAFYYWIASGGWFFTAQPDSWAASLCIMAIAPFLVINREIRGWRIVFSGLLIGCVGLIKPVYLVVGAAPLLSITLTNFPRRQRIRLAAVLAMSTAAPLVLACSYFWWRGALSQAIEVHILYALSTYASLDTGTPAIKGFRLFFSQSMVALLMPFVASGAWILRKQPRVFWPLLIWLGATILAVVVQGKYYFQHWMPVYPPLLMLAVLGAYQLKRFGNDAKIVAWGSALMFTFLVCAQPLLAAVRSVYFLDIKHTPDAYYASFQFEKYNSEDQIAAARYIRAHTNPRDGVFVWGNDATARYLTNRPNPTRFTFEMPLSLQGAYRARYRIEVMQQLRVHPPTYFMVGMNWWNTDTKQQSLEKFPDLNTFLNQNYHLETSFGNLDLYRHN